MEPQETAAYFNYWAKLDRGADPADTPYHLFPYHSLDVAAVGLKYLKKCPLLVEFLTKASGADEQTLIRWMVYFLLLHDIGKLSSSFQSLGPVLTDATTDGGRRIRRYGQIRHDGLGYLLWKEQLSPMLKESGFFGRQNSESDYWGEYFSCWSRATICHHGIPPKEEQLRTTRLKHWFSEQNQQAASEFLSDIQDLLPPAPAQPTMAADLETLCERCYPKVLSWWLAGFTILCDWLGSNRDTFRYLDRAIPLKDYWNNHALPAADSILADSGILSVPAAPTLEPRQLFDYLKELTPLQRQVAEMPLGTGPQLFLLEDVTGAGKTEAAYLLMNRLMSAGLGSGFYMALPTMATANSLYRRGTDVYQRLFEPGSKPSLVLAHGSANLDKTFTDSIAPATTDGDTDYDQTEASATSYCNAWLTDNRKKALHANAGIGTLDQALLSVLQSRHQSLRLLGLFGKILVVDEVHASDAYMHRLLQTLLELHATAGGSAILLSATLAKKMRAELAGAFAKGLGAAPANPRQDAYPLLTRIDAESLVEQPLDTRESVKRSLSFNTFADTETALDWITEQAGLGRCVCWIRNSVADALETYDHLIESGRIAADKLTLFHARFGLQDRLDIEQSVLDRFGPDSTPEDRSGQVLIATQVVEQSLDLDFDEMLSDLAPIDLLLQRAGRLRRHRRHRNGKRIERTDEQADERGAVTLRVLTPAPHQDDAADWLDEHLHRTALIYEDLGQLWRSSLLISSGETLDVPGNVRRWIENVYGDGAPELPPAITSASDNAEGNRKSDAGLAKANAIDAEDGYFMGPSGWWDEIHTPTRLGDPSVRLRLARWKDGQLLPMAETNKHAWPLSEVSIRASALKTSSPADTECEVATNKLMEEWRNPRYFKLLALTETESGNWTAQGNNAKDEKIQILYSKTRGLEIKDR